VTPKLLHVFSTFAPGGPQVRTARLIAALDDQFEHSITAMDGNYDAFSLLPSDLEVRRVENPPKLRAIASVRALRKLLRAERPDLLCTYNWGAIEAVLAARTLSIPTLHHEDGFLPDEAGGFKRRRVLTRRLALRWPRAVVVPSHRLHEIATSLWLLPARKVRLVPNGVRVQDYAERDGNPALRDALGVPRDAFLVGAVGHLRREKNPVRAVQALGRMKARAHLLLLGDGPEREPVERAARELDLEPRVHLAGHVADPRGHYAAMDAFAISSDTEQMPVALLEAMASALPVAATDVGDVRRMVPDEGAPLVEGVDAGALAAGLDRLAADPALRARLGAAGRDKVRELYSFEGMVDAYRALYQGAD